MPFTVEQFLEVFRQYNIGTWPMPIALYVMGVFAVFFGTRRAPASDLAISYILAFFWLWMGLAYHFAFFSAINKAAFLFGALFIGQSLMFFFYRNKLVFRFQKNVYGIAGGVLVFYALIIYPMIGYFNGHIFPASPTFGLPCPTTIFTFGILLWTLRGVPIFLLIIPFLWSLVGGSAAFLLGILEDTGLPIAGVAAIFLLTKRDFFNAQAIPN